MDLKKYLDDRIKHLKKVEMDYFNKSVDIERDKISRRMNRNFSNEMMGRRHELEEIKKFIAEQSDPKG